MGTLGWSNPPPSVTSQGPPPPSHHNPRKGVPGGGSGSSSTQVAFAVGPGIACWFSSLAGFYLSPSSIPIGYKWVYWLNPPRVPRRGGGGCSLA